MKNATSASERKSSRTLSPRAIARTILAPSAAQTSGRRYLHRERSCAGECSIDEDGVTMADTSVRT